MNRPKPPKKPVPYRSLRAILWGLVALSLPALVWAWRPGFPQDEAAEIPVKAVLAVVITLLVVLRELSPALVKNRAGAALALAAVLGVAAYLNFGKFHGRTFLHHWEQFHYSLGAKYFPELGYDGLYDASIEAQRALDSLDPLQTYYRDLRTNQVVITETPAVAAARREVVARFSPARWQAFVEDHRYFVEHNTRGYLASIRVDHGFNPPPSWIFVARLFSGWPQFDGDTLALFGVLDLALLAATFVVVSRTYGTRWGCLALALFGINYAGRFFWVGGAFLREDWLAAVVIGICLLERKRYRTAGACLAYAAMVRIFPLLFFFGPAIVALRETMQTPPSAPRRLPRWAIDFALGAALAVTVSFAAGCLTGRGPAAWSEFASHIRQHEKTWLTNNVGFKNVVLYDTATFRRENVDFSLPEPWIHWQAKMDGLAQSRRPLIWLGQAVLLLLIGAAAWRLDAPRAAMLGPAVIFTMLLTTCYYWQMLLVVPLQKSRRLLYGMLALNLGLHALHFATESFEMRYGLMSWGLLVMYGVFLAPFVMEMWQERFKKAAIEGA